MTDQLHQPAVTYRTAAAEPVQDRTSAANAFDWLLKHARERPDSPAIRLWTAGAVREELSYAGLLDQVTVLAGALHSRGIRAGHRVVVSLPNGPSFTSTVLAAIRLGAIAVPAPVPTVSRWNAFAERLVGIIDDSGAVACVTTQQFADGASALVGQPGRHLRILELETLLTPETHVALPAPDRRFPAIIQYTSGSTKRPRGVVITHQNLAAVCRQAAAAYQEGPKDSAVTWVPLYHDMGMVSGVMRPLYSGYCTTLLTPEEFIRDPRSWFAALSHCGGTLSSAPNFAYAYAVRKIAPSEVQDFDLRTWRVARNAGEGVRASTVREFTAHFAAAGFPARGMCPSYGLAEATLAMTTCSDAVLPMELTVDAAALASGRVVPCPDPPVVEQDTQVLISSGTASPESGLHIDSGARDVGEIHISGPQVSPGYWSQFSGPGAIPERLDGWYPTGDTGFVKDGHLFVLGRMDDTLIVNGCNYFMADLTAACERVEGIRRGRLAVFRGSDEQRGSIRVVAETADGAGGDPDLAGMRSRIRKALAERTGLYAASVEFVRAGNLPVTTSGKVQVSRVRREFEAGVLPLITGPVAALVSLGDDSVPGG
ncbi:acyl-CoA synthetase (AMP-forming)/AMP-acid ligase II [Streptomyces sp. 846.5]|nr:AMP-binding protein [Streptomyces sp. 846.5]TDU04457.1 acyl-CoA synthetase (AMP-forming)/AMP-acid ligase II [Streptomyces sp. 846.5]